MKKVLSSLLLTSATILMFGQVQVIVNENFNSLTAGNLAGQNSWLISGGTATDYQVAAIDTAHGLSLTTTSGNGYVATSNPNNRTAARVTTVVATAANNIVHATADIYTGSSTGAGEYRFVVVGTTGTTTVAIGGFTYNVATKKLNGLGTFNNAGVPTLYLAVADATAPVFPVNTWVTVSYSYNKTTGAMSWSWPGGGSSVTTDPDQITGMVAKDVYLQNLTATGNTVNNTVGIDNILAQFGNTTTLSINDVNTVPVNKKSVISLYPNPTSDILNIKSDSKINAVSVVDMTGRKVNVKLEGNQVDVRELPVGNYLINIETKDGISTEKFIKK
ncbi:T9SS type A sorting domain-containing protein [Chryseobacterium aahli]|uniref:T9SS type A sorting domain-containing protein n=1 Tax=Chryseobacterium aahli TaxID=1278643 RepID=UPI001F616BBB|nr:T9SS type A sorting domain-containing protein [Chryseobacterium aahli]MCI3935976.1 T9SS type A sorting domain-containing protein [Chryseobacterium aahli]